MQFKTGEIDGVVHKPIKRHVDSRGWLAEVFRWDELGAEFHPQMGYISVSKPGVVRGPHEHHDQADLFVFMGPGNFDIYVWDNRKKSATFGNRLVLHGGEDAPLSVLIPAGVVHAYKNVSKESSLVHNYPNRLFKGEKREEEIDEIRHEDDPNSPFQVPS